MILHAARAAHPLKVGVYITEDTLARTPSIERSFDISFDAGTKKAPEGA